MVKAHSNGEAAPAASASASTLILLQVSARALTFVLNQLLVRLVSPSIFGLANIQLELLLSTILFLSRDGFRTILIRTEPASTQDATKSASSAQTGPRKGTTNSIHNISLIPIPLGFTFTLVASTVYAIFISPTSTHSMPTFHASIFLYAIGALAELAYEPLLIRAVRLGQPALRVKAEGTAVFVKVISTIATILVLPKWSTAPSYLQAILKDEKAVALLAFGIGQASFGSTMLAVHLSHFVARYGIGQTLDLYIPRPETVTRKDAAKTETAWIDRPTMSLCVAMSQQAILKHALTEADKFAVAKYASLEDQGGYALASNYGSLVARILFQPVEETSRIVFSSELAALDPESAEYEKAKSNANNATLARVSGMLSAMFRLHLLLACVMTTFGGPLSTAFLYIMAGPLWALKTSAPAILAAYTFYLPIMGINGIVEGFLQSVASQRQVSQYSKILMTASAGFVAALAASNALVERTNLADSFLAKTGLVWANALSLSVRAGWCWSFLLAYFKLATSEASIVDQIKPSAALPSRLTIALFAIIAFILRAGVPRIMPTTAELLLSSTASQLGSRAVRVQAIRSLLPTLALAGGCLGAVLGSILLFERKALLGALRSLASRRSTPTQTRETRKMQ
ncbi:related to nuclear division protein Rft1 [Ustilago trichophora]|uniref:Man(5)GlcNAc(2)-PP-dolichol translocation protein RFT1 n=1 Tax=Ustilago trichophora TaxID=86804 RepID=A0A5C3ERD1_9BASI|nr:related to nuclear division protein Rft1 [Ustilago trichophora]